MWPLSYSTAVTLLSWCLTLGESSKFSEIASNPAYYPRALVMDNYYLACVGRKTSLQIIQSSNLSGNVWIPGSFITTDSAASSSLDNCFLFRCADKTLLATYRHHLNCTGAVCLTFRIMLSRSSDNGVTWESPEVVMQSSPPYGLWEPFIYFQTPNTTRLAIVYSKELPLNAKSETEQDIVQQSSQNNGITWSPAVLVWHRPSSRNGMPGVTTLGKNKLGT